MKSKITSLIFLLLPILCFSQESYNKISFTYFNNLNLGEKSINTNFYGQFDSEIVLLDSEVYNNTLQFEYERWVSGNLFLFANLGYTTKNFKGMLERKEEGYSVVYAYPVKQKYNFATGGLGIKYYFKFKNINLFSKIGLNSEFSLNKPEDFIWLKRNEIMHTAKRVNNFLIGFGLTSQIHEKLKYRIEFNLNNSINPIIDLSLIHI